MKAVQQNNIANFNNPTQTEAYKLYAPSLEHINWILDHVKDFECVVAGH